MATLNLWGLFGDWERRKAVVAWRWPKVEADVLLVQEGVSDGATDQVAELAGLLGYPWVFRGCPESDERESIAILSRLRAGDPEQQPLPASTPRRCVLSASVQTPARELRVAVTHLAFKPLAARERQLRALAALTGDPLIVGGDLNADAQLVRPVLESAGFEDALEWANIPTWPCSAQHFSDAWKERVGRKPHFSLEGRRLDWLVTRGVKTSDAGVMFVGDHIRGFASDHALLYVDVEL